MTTLSANAKVGLAAYYQFEAFKVDEDGSEVPNSRRIVLPWFKNLITDLGMDYLGNAPSSRYNLTYCRLGTGNAAAANGDQSLYAQVAATSTAGLGAASGLSVAGDYVYNRVSRRFAAGTASGVNLAEVGMSYTNTGNTLFSRSLLKDGSGNPTTISLQPDEVLDVVYELRVYLPAQDIVVNTTIDGVATTVTIRRSTNTTQVNWWAQALGYTFIPYSRGDEQGYLGFTGYDAYENSIAAATGWGGGNNTTEAVRTLLAYVAGSYTTKVKLDFGLTVGNYPTGIGFITCGTVGLFGDSRFNCSYGPFGYIINPKMNKTSARTATVTLGLTWARV